MSHLGSHTRRILPGLKTVFAENLTAQLKIFVDNKISRGEFAWPQGVNLTLEDAVAKITNGLQIDLVEPRSAIDREQMLEDLLLIQIYLFALELESRNIDHTLGTHELLRKDNVQEITDIKRRYLDIVNHSTREYRTQNIEIRSGQIRLFPVLSRNFQIKDVETTYEPETFVQRVGNDPTPENISPGTDHGFWETTIFQSGNNAVRAVVTLKYNAMIGFNRLRINTAGKFPCTLVGVEILKGDTWESVHVEDVTSKFVNVTYDTVNETDTVRLTLEQRMGDYTWWTLLDNKKDILQEETAEAAQEKATQKSIDTDEFTPVILDRLENVYAFQIGAFNIITYLDIYPGDKDGIFYSRRFTREEPLETVQLSPELIEDRPGDSTITYTILQQDGSRVSINPGEKVRLTKTYNLTETISSPKRNYVELKHAPLAEDIQVTVNGLNATRVESFSDTGALQFIISGRRLYFSENIENRVVTVNYDHRTEFVIIEIVLNNGTAENQFSTPFVENFGVLLNGTV